MSQAVIVIRGLDRALRICQRLGNAHEHELAEASKRAGERIVSLVASKAPGSMARATRLSEPGSLFASRPIAVAVAHPGAAAYTFGRRRYLTGYRRVAGGPHAGGTIRVVPVGQKARPFVQPAFAVSPDIVIDEAARAVKRIVEAA